MRGLVPEMNQPAQQGAGFLPENWPLASAGCWLAGLQQFCVGCRFPLQAAAARGAGRRRRRRRARRRRPQLPPALPHTRRRQQQAEGPAEGHQPGRVTSGKTGINLSRPALLPSRPPVAHRRCRGGAARCSQPLSSSQRVSLSAAAHRTAPAAPRARTTRGSHRPTSGENLVTWPT
jgi:hypothetical protein